MKLKYNNKEEETGVITDGDQRVSRALLLYEELIQIRFLRAHCWLIDGERDESKSKEE